MISHPLKLKDNRDSGGGDPGPGRNISSRFLELFRKEGMFCALCFNLVTFKYESIEKKGSHVHTFANPAGHVFEIGCFRQARGCSQQGPVCNDFTWFSGYSWQVVVCSECLAHLGWFFSARSRKGFFGLILSQLITSWED